MADPYFTVAEARAATWMGGALTSTTTYASADIDAMRVAVEDAIERECGVAFVPRTATNELHDGSGTYDLLTEWARPTAVTAASVGPKGSRVALTADQLALIDVYKDGRVYYPNGWPTGRANVLLTYTHGWATVPGRVKRAAMLAVKRFLVDSPISDRATSMVSAEGQSQFFVTAGVRDAIFDVPEVNAVIREYGVDVGGVG